MGAAINCWEYSRCGREPGGTRVGEMGVCPATTLTSADGYLGGRNGGRACAYVAGTYCSGTVQGTYRDKSKQCQACEFYRLLRAEHGAACSVLAFTAFARARDPDGDPAPDLPPG